MAEKNKIKVFLSYANENLEMIRKIDSGLRDRNLDVWFDKRCLGPGTWKKQIEKAIPKSRYFIICLSKAALKKTGGEPGFQDDELQQAYEIARMQPEQSFTIVPVRIEDCSRGDHRLSPWQQYDLFDEFEAELDHLAVHMGGMSPDNKKSTDSRTKAEEYIDSLKSKSALFYFIGEYDESLNCINSIINLEPDCADAWANKGAVLSDLNRNEEAIAASDKALEIKPDLVEAWNNKGNALSNLDQKEEALAAYDKALEIKPDYEQVWYNKGSSLSGLDRKKEAIAAFDKALEIKPAYKQAWYNKGNALWNLGRHEEALAAYDKALEIDPNYSKAWGNKADLLYSLDRKKEAKAAYKNFAHACGSKSIGLLRRIKNYIENKAHR